MVGPDWAGQSVAELTLDRRQSEGRPRELQPGLSAMVPDGVRKQARGLSAVPLREWPSEQCLFSRERMPYHGRRQWRGYSVKAVSVA